MARPLALPLLAVLSAACAAGGGPARLGPWRHLATARFDLLTDLEPAAAHRLAGDAERLRATLGAVLPDPGGPPPPRARLVVFADRAPLHDLSGPRVAGYFTTATGRPTVVMSAERGVERTVLAHELAHLLVAERMPGAPSWLREGLAEWMESAGDPEAAGRVGLRPPWARPGWPDHRGVARRLFGWAGDADRASPRRDPEAAWLLVSYLATAEAARFDRYLRALQREVPAAIAWDLTFPEWSPSDEVGPEVLEIRAARAHALGWIAVRRPDGRPEPGLAERTFPPAEARALLLELPRRQRRTVGALRAEVAALLADDPDHPVGLRWRAQLDGLPPLPLARRAVAAHGSDWRAWHFLAAALTDPRRAEERVRALARASALAPGQPEPRLALVQAILQAGRTAPLPPVEGSGGD